MKKTKRILKIVDSLVQQCFDSYGQLIDDRAERTVQSLAKLPGVYGIILLSEFSKRLKFEIAKTTLLLESVLPLPEQAVLQITQNFAKTRKVNQTDTLINPSLLGGLRVRIGDHIYDDSLVSKINELRKELEDE